MSLESISTDEIKQIVRISHMGFNKEFLENISPEITSYYLARKLRHGDKDVAKTALEILIHYGPMDVVLNNLISIYKKFPSSRPNIFSIMKEFGEEYQQMLD